MIGTDPRRLGNRHGSRCLERSRASGSPCRGSVSAPWASLGSGGRRVMSREGWSRPSHRFGRRPATVERAFPGSVSGAPARAGYRRSRAFDAHGTEMARIGHGADRHRVTARALGPEPSFATRTGWANFRPSPRRFAERRRTRSAVAGSARRCPETRLKATSYGGFWVARARPPEPRLTRDNYCYRELSY